MSNIAKIYSIISSFDLHIDKKYYYKRLIYLVLYKVLLNQLELINMRGYDKTLTLIIIMLLKYINKYILSEFQESNDKVVIEIEKEQLEILYKFNEYNKKYITTVPNQSDIFLLNYIYNINLHVIQTRLLSQIIEIQSLICNILYKVTLNPVQFGCLMVFIDSIVFDMFNNVVKTSDTKNKLVMDIENNNNKIIDDFFNNRNIIYECEEEQYYMDKITKNIHEFYNIIKDYSPHYRLNNVSDDFECNYHLKVAILNYIIPTDPLLIWIYRDLKWICNNFIFALITYNDMQQKIDKLEVNNLKNILLLKPKIRKQIDINGIKCCNLFIIKPLSFKPDTDVIFCIPREIKIPACKWITITGDSGCGKTTLFNMLLKIIKDDTNKICFVDKYQKYDYDMIRKFVSNVKPNMDLFDDSILFNIKFGVANANSTRVDQDIRKYLIDFGLERFIDTLDTNINKISTGEKQRIKIIRCILQNKMMWMFDEVTANIDSDVEIKIMNVLRRIQKEKKKSVLHITHNKSLLRYSDCRIVFKDNIVSFEKTN